MMRLLFRLSLRCAALLLCAVSVSGQAQEDAPDDPSPPAIQNGAPLTQQLIEHRKQDLEAAELSDDDKARCRALYQQAAEQLKLAEERQAAAAQWKKVLASAPETLAQHQQALSQPRKSQEIDISADASVAALEQLLAAARQRLADGEAKVKQLQQEPSRRADRRLQAAKEKQAAEELMARIDEALKAPVAPGQPMQIALAERTLQQASRMAAERELGMLAAEIPAYDATHDLLNAELQLAKREILDSQEAVQQLADHLEKRRRERTAEQAREARAALARAHPLLRPVAEETLRLTNISAGADGLTARIKATESALQDVKVTTVDVEALQAELNDKLDLLDGSSYLGEFLLRVRRSLPRDSELQRSLHLRNREIAQARIELANLRRDKGRLDNLDDELNTLRGSFSDDVSSRQRETLLQAAEELFTRRRELLRDLESDYTTYYNLLNDLNLHEQQLRAKARRVEELVDRKLMWVRGHAFYSRSDLRQVPGAARWLLQYDNWQTVGHDAWSALRQRPVLCIASLLLFVALALWRKPLQRRLNELGREAASSYLVPYETTMRALGITFLLTWLWPSLVFGLGWCLFFFYAGADFTRAVGAGLIVTGSVYVVLELTRRVLGRNGLAEAHFRWTDRRILLARRHLIWLSVSLLPILFFMEQLHWEGNPQRQDGLGRLLFVAALVLVSIFMHRVLRPLPQVVEGVETGNNSTLTKLAYWCAVLVPLLIGVLSLVGYHFTAWQLAFRLFVTACLVLAVLVFHGLAVRWLRLVRGRLALHQAQQRREAREQASDSEMRGTQEAEAEVEPEIDLQAVNRQTRQLLHVCVAVAAVAGLWLIWLQVLPFHELLERPLWSKMAAGAPDAGAESTGPAALVHVVAVSDLLLAVLILLLALLASRNIPGLIEISLPTTAPLDSGARYALSTIVRYVLVGGGIVAALSMIDIGWSRVQWLVAALSVGVGFGLQELVANFISGLILLFERPVRVGDIVTVDDVTGVVTRVQIRATTIRNWDRQDYIVPNKDLITGRVLNWTLSNEVNRVVITVGVAYASDPQAVRGLLQEIVGNYEHIVDDPAPLITFEGFGDSTLNFVVRAFLANMDNRMETINDLHTIIHQRFEAAGIEIAFPQRDINVRSLPHGALDSAPLNSQSGEETIPRGEALGDRSTE